MINAIIKGIFYLISMLASAILSPIISVITALFPSLSSAISNVTLYFSNILMYVPLCLDFLMIPRDAIVFLFDYYLIKYTIYISIRVIRACITIYNKLKL